MNVILINGSPDAKGCTYTALEEVAKTLEAEGIETEIIHVGNKNIRGCIGCRKCKTDGKCVFNDIVNEVSDKFAKCDGIVIGSPVYYASANGTLISFLDRLFYSLDADKTMKVGAAVVSARELVQQQLSMSLINILQFLICQLSQVNIGIWFMAILLKMLKRMKKVYK